MTPLKTKLVSAIFSQFGSCMLKYSNFYFRWGDITLNTASNGARYLQLNERQTKTSSGENLSDIHEVIHKIYETKDERGNSKKCYQHTR
jgi:hypothetical protein